MTQADYTPQATALLRVTSGGFLACPVMAGGIGLGLALGRSGQTRS